MRREVIVAAALLAIAPPAAAADGLPRVLRFSVVPELIEVGQSATILYAEENADRVAISGFGSVDFAGSITVGPSESVRYSLTATNAAGSFTVVAGVLVVRTTSPPPRSFTLSTNRLDYFDVAVGGSRTFAVTIDPLETVDIQLTLQQPANGPFRLLGTEPSFTAASAKRVELAFRPTAAGSSDATLEVRNARRSEVDVVSLHANGVTPPGALLSAVVSVAGPSTGLNGSHWVSIYGERLSEITREWSAEDFRSGALPTSLEGVRVLLDGIPGYVSFVSPNQVNVLLPDLPLGPASLTLITRHGSRGGYRVQLDRLAPAFLTRFVGDRLFPLATHPDGVLAGPPEIAGEGVPVRGIQPGQTILIYMIGLGRTEPIARDGFLLDGPLRAGASALRLGNLTLTPDCALVSPGLYVLTVKIPAVGGGTIPIKLSSGSYETKAPVFITID